MPDAVLIYGAPEGSADLFHAIPVGIIDPFLYVEAGDRRAATVSVLDADKVRPLGIEILDPYALGRDELLAEGRPAHEIEAETALRACRELGVTEATVPPGFPLDVADHLRANGVQLAIDRDLFLGRRRAKNAAELEGVRRAQRAAEAGMRAITALLAAAEPGEDGVLVLDGEPLTVERVKPEVEAAFAQHGASSEGFIVGPGAQGAVGHDLGSGPIPSGVPVICDLWPQDRASGCFADMTRTFVAGVAPEDVAAWHALCREALERSVATVRAGVATRDVWAAACDVFEAAGHPTQRTKAQGEILREGFFHSLGHGVGLQVHEAPLLGRSRETLVAGDVLAIEPGTYRQGIGGVRLEDLVLVTDDGAEVLTDFPYGLEPA